MIGEGNTTDTAKRERLEKAGFRVGTVAEFLGLTPAQSDLIEIKLTFTDALKRQRKISGLTQADLAGKIGSSQSRIAKMERGDPYVSLDLICLARSDDPRFTCRRNDAP